MLSQWESAARLVRRTGFGASGADVDAAVRMGTARYVSSVLAADPAADPGARATPPPQFTPIDYVGAGAGKAAKKQLNKQRKDQLRAMTAWWVRRMVAVQTPFGEKLTFHWHNHFATSAKKVKDPGLMLEQNAKLRTLGRGDFHALAYAMLTDAAMLRWLDGQQNTSKAPNENLSREFMELFTLGHGDAYTETDVREGARALTGWRASSGGSTEFRTDLHDNRVEECSRRDRQPRRGQLLRRRARRARVVALHRHPDVGSAGFGHAAERRGRRPPGGQLRAHARPGRDARGDADGARSSPPRKARS